MTDINEETLEIIIDPSSDNDNPWAAYNATVARCDTFKENRTCKDCYADPCIADYYKPIKGDTMENLQTIKVAINNVDNKIADRVAANGDTPEDTKATEFLASMRGTVMVFGIWSEVFATLIEEEMGSLNNKTLLAVDSEINRLGHHA
jgi:hypothetical protein